jgi:hypothetical protein
VRSPEVSKIIQTIFSFFGFWHVRIHFYYFRSRVFNYFHLTSLRHYCHITPSTQEFPSTGVICSSLLYLPTIMVFLHLFIVNKSGGLIHHRALSPKAPKIGTNEWLRIGSTFHSLHAIAAEASPLRMPGNKNACTLRCVA